MRALPFGADLHSPRREGSRSAAILEPRGAAAAPAEEAPAAPEHHAADRDRDEPDHGRAEEHRPRDREDDLEEDLEAAPHGEMSSDCRSAISKDNVRRGSLLPIAIEGPMLSRLADQQTSATLIRSRRRFRLRSPALLRASARGLPSVSLLGDKSCLNRGGPWQDLH